MDEILKDIRDFKYINKELLEKIINNINKNIKMSIEKSNFTLGKKLQEYKKILLLYIKQYKYINNEDYLKILTNKLQKLHKEILANKEILVNKEDNLIEIYIPKFRSEYINLLILFIYKFSKINHKILSLLFYDYIKKLYNIIKNDGDKNYNKFVSIYNLLEKNPNNNLEIFIKYIKKSELKNELLTNMKIKLDYLYNKNEKININDIDNLEIIQVRNENKNENIDIDIYRDIYKKILKNFYKKYDSFTKQNYEKYLKLYIEKIFIYNNNNLEDILNKNLRFEYNINKKKIEIIIDLHKNDKTYVYNNILKLLEKINKYDINNKLKVYNIKLNSDTIINIKIFILILIIDIIKNDKYLLLKPNSKFLNYIISNNLKTILENNIIVVLDNLYKEKNYNLDINDIRENIIYFKEKNINNIYDLDPNNILFNNKEDYFEECKNIIIDFYNNNNEYLNDYIKFEDKLKEELNKLYEKEYKITFNDLIKTLKVEDVNKVKLNFTDNQEYIYNILINNLFSNKYIINYNLNNDKEENINIYIYKSSNNFINIFLIYLNYILKKNKKNICTNIKKILLYFKKELIKITNLNKYDLGCKHINEYTKIETLCRSNYMINYDNNKVEYINLKKISIDLLDIIEKNNFKVTYDENKNNFKIIVINTKNINSFNNKIVKYFGKDITKIIVKDINKIIIKLIVQFIENITNIFINIISNSELILNILNIPINDEDEKNIYYYLNTTDKNNVYYTENLKIRKLCIIIFIKLFMRHILYKLSKGTSINNIFNTMINNIQKIFCKYLNIEFRYDSNKILEDFINKYSFVYTT